MAAEEEPTTPEDEPDDDHLADLPDGFGCVEVWEHLSDAREND